MDKEQIRHFEDSVGEAIVQLGADKLVLLEQAATEAREQLAKIHARIDAMVRRGELVGTK
jgi:hypothetical protein